MYGNTLFEHESTLTKPNFLVKLSTHIVFSYVQSNKKKISCAKIRSFVGNGASVLKIEISVS